MCLLRNKTARLLCYSNVWAIWSEWQWSQTNARQIHVGLHQVLSTYPTFFHEKPPWKTKCLNLGIQGSKKEGRVWFSLNDGFGVSSVVFHIVCDSNLVDHASANVLLRRAVVSSLLILTAIEKPLLIIKAGLSIISFCFYFRKHPLVMFRTTPTLYWSRSTHSVQDEHGFECVLIGAGSTGHCLHPGHPAGRDLI